MANKRDLDIHVGAKTDQASFRRAEQRTEGFLKKLRRSVGLGGSGGQTPGVDPLQQTARAAEMVGKIAQVAAIMKEGVAVFNSGLEISRGLMAGIRGDAESLDASLTSAKEAIGQSLVGAAGLSVGEAIFGDQRDAQKIQDETREAAQKNASRLAAAQKARQAIAQVERQIEEHRRTSGLEGLRLEEARLRISTENRIAALEAATRETQNGLIKKRQQEAINLLLEQQRDLEQGIADRRRAAFEAQQRDAENRVRSFELVNTAEARLFGKEGVEREIELIRLRTEARIRELNKVKETLQESGRILRIEQIIADVVDRSNREIEDAKTRASSAIQPDTPAFRPGAPAAASGLLISGAAQAARTGRSFEVRQLRAIEENGKKQDETVEALRLILDETRRGPAPVLN